MKKETKTKTNIFYNATNKLNKLNNNNNNLNVFYNALERQAYVPPHRQRKVNGPSKNVSTLNLLKRKPLKYTRHGECRMNCRHVTDRNIKNLLKTGKIDWAKSTPRPHSGCPVYRIKSNTSKRQLAGVFGACKSSTDLVTVINTGRNWVCPPC